MVDAPLYLDVHEHPGLLSVVGSIDLHQLVGQPPTELCVANDLLQLRVEELETPRPVDPALSLGKEELEELGKKRSSTCFQGLS